MDGPAGLARRAASGAPACRAPPEPTASAWRRGLADFERADTAAARVRILLDEETLELVETYPTGAASTRYDRELEVVATGFCPIRRLVRDVPRSQGPLPSRHGTLRDCIDDCRTSPGMGFERDLPCRPFTPSA